MRSGVTEAERFRVVRCDRAPHNRGGKKGAAPRGVRGAAVGQRDQMRRCSPFSPPTRVA